MMLLSPVSGGTAIPTPVPSPQLAGLRVYTDLENANQLLQAGRLKEAVQALSAEVRNHPSDTKRRTFLFELLCFSGEYDRAEKQLHMLAEASPNSEAGALFYRSALHAERTRQDLFQRKGPGLATARPIPHLRDRPYKARN